MKRKRTSAEERPTVDDLCRVHRDERAHSQHVTEMALQVFDAVRPFFNLKRADRAVLETAARLHDIGYAARPDDHVAAGLEIVRREGLRGHTDRQVRAICAVMAMHSGSPAALAAEELLRDAAHPDRLHRLGAILRVADALDTSHLQDARILRVARDEGMIRLRVAAPAGSGNAERAMAKSDLWQRVFALGLVIEPVRRPAPRLRAAMPARTAIRRLLLEQYPRLRTALRRAAREDDEEALHDLRLALRAIRVLLEAFERPLRKTSAADVADAVRALARELGPARDMDVWIETLQRPSIKAALARHASFMDAQRRAHGESRAALRALLDRETARGLAHRLGFLVRIELGDPPGRFAPAFGSMARRVLRGMWKDLMKRREWVASRKPRKLHAFRIRLRKLRILASLVAPALQAGAHAVVDELRAMERLLGRIHDLDEALARAAACAEAPPALLPALARRRRARWRDFKETWSAFDTRATRRMILERLSKKARGS